MTMAHTERCLKSCNGLANLRCRNDPDSGQPVERLISAASVPRPAGGPIKGDISNRNLEKLGFTKYQKTSTGKYEKIMGDGPSLINRGDD